MRASPATKASTRPAGDAGEALAEATLRCLGYDYYSVPKRRWRRFLDFETRQQRLGMAITEDGDFLDLFDIFAWSARNSLRIQIKNHQRVVAPPKKWRERVEELAHPPGLLDSWWSKDPDAEAWWAYRFDPDKRLWTVASMDTRGRALSPWSEYKEGASRGPARG